MSLSKRLEEAVRERRATEDQADRILERRAELWSGQERAGGDVQSVAAVAGDLRFWLKRRLQLADTVCRLYEKGRGGCHCPGRNRQPGWEANGMSTVTAVLILCQSANPQSPEALLHRTWEAVCQVESGGNPRAVNKGEGAAGIGQIRPIMVAEANRLQQARTFTLAQRYDPLLSYEIFRIYCLHYWPQGGPEQWARGWNGGPAGPRKAATGGYWSKVRAQMDGVPGPVVARPSATWRPALWSWLAYLLAGGAWAGLLAWVNRAAKKIA